MSLTADRQLEILRVAGDADVRAGADSDAVDEVTPHAVVEPATPEALARTLAWCSSHRQSTVIAGGGSKMLWGRPPAPIDVLIGTKNLSRVTRHEPGDLTVTVQAGMPVSRLNAELARHRQWLPLDTRSESSTIGGAIATNDSGPLRHRHGAPRDLLIGIRLATADGRLAAAGGNVVKNVAGYDLGKLMAGSFGSLAAIVSATFKLSPVPAASSTVTAAFGDARSLSQAAAEIVASQLDPISVEAEAHLAPADDGASFELLVRFAGVREAVADQAAAAEQLMAPAGPLRTERVADGADVELWDRRRRSFWERPGTVVKASWMPARLADVLTLLGEVARGGVRAELTGRAALGVGLLRLSGDLSARASAVALLRDRRETIDHVVVVHGERDLRNRVDVWGPLPSATPVLRAVRQALDPAGILNAARGPLHP
jgi:glycolate oxidase FAD binding subunit